MMLEGWRDLSGINTRSSPGYVSVCLVSTFHFFLDSTAIPYQLYIWAIKHFFGLMLLLIVTSLSSMLSVTFYESLFLVLLVLVHVCFVSGKNGDCKQTCFYDCEFVRNIASQEKTRGKQWKLSF